MYASASRKLALAQYYHALDEHAKALKEAVAGLSDLGNALKAQPISNQKQRLEKALAVYDLIKSKKPLPISLKIDYLTSKIGECLFLPADAWNLDQCTVDEYAGDEFTDPEMPSSNWTWTRPQNPQMRVDGDEIAQAALGDCSVVATLISIAERVEPLLLKRIYPQVNGQPVISPSGRYIVVLEVDGTPRAVEIDSQFPSAATPLHLSTLKGSLWPLLCEKAYMKLMGGYYFAGSHAAVDTYTFLGWVPNYVDLSVWSAAHPGKSVADLFDEWAMRWRARKLLISLGTGPEPHKELAPSHDYAVVSIVPGRVKVVNPWHSGEKRGEWYTWDEVFALFRIVYINVDPNHYEHQMRTHLMANAALASTLFGAPQYTVTNKDSRPRTVSIFAVLKVPFRPPPRGYLSLYAYDANHKIVTTTGTALLKRTPENSSLCATLNLSLAANSSATIVAVCTELQALSSLVLTVQSFSAGPFLGIKAKLPGYNAKATGQWTLADPSASINEAKYGDNPQFLVTLDKPAAWLVVHFIPETAVASHLMVFHGRETITAPDISRNLATSGSYQTGAKSVRLEHLPAGRYVVIPSVYPAKPVKFTILACASGPVKLDALPAARAGLFERSIEPQVSSVRYVANRHCMIYFQIDADGFEVRFSVFNHYGRLLGSSGDFRSGRVTAQASATEGFCRIEQRGRSRVELKAFAEVPVSMTSGDWTI